MFYHDDNAFSRTRAALIESKRWDDRLQDVFDAQRLHFKEFSELLIHFSKNLKPDQWELILNAFIQYPNAAYPLAQAIDALPPDLLNEHLENLTINATKAIPYVNRILFGDDQKEIKTMISEEVKKEISKEDKIKIFKERWKEFMVNKKEGDDSLYKTLIKDPDLAYLFAIQRDQDLEAFLVNYNILAVYHHSKDIEEEKSFLDSIRRSLFSYPQFTQELLGGLSLLSKNDDLYRDSRQLLLEHPADAHKLGIAILMLAKNGRFNSTTRRYIAKNAHEAVERVTQLIKPKKLLPEEEKINSEGVYDFIVGYYRSLEDKDPSEIQFIQTMDELKARNVFFYDEKMMYLINFQNEEDRFDFATNLLQVTRIHEGLPDHTRDALHNAQRPSDAFAILEALLDLYEKDPGMYKRKEQAALESDDPLRNLILLNHSPTLDSPKKYNSDLIQAIGKEFIMVILKNYPNLRAFASIADNNSLMMKVGATFINLLNGVESESNLNLLASEIALAVTNVNKIKEEKIIRFGYETSLASDLETGEKLATLSGAEQEDKESFFSYCKKFFDDQMEPWNQWNNILSIISAAMNKIHKPQEEPLPTQFNTVDSMIELTDLAKEELNDQLKKIENKLPDSKERKLSGPTLFVDSKTDRLPDKKPLEEGATQKPKKK